MAVWEADDVIGDRIDFEIARDGFARWIADPARRTAAFGSLEAAGYRLLEFDATGWNDKRDMLSEIGRALAFPDHFGVNLDALADCLGDVAEGAYGWTGQETGLVLVFSTIDTFRQLDEHATASLVEIIADQSRYAALFGNRVLSIWS